MCTWVATMCDIREVEVYRIMIEGRLTLRSKRREEIQGG